MLEFNNGHFSWCSSIYYYSTLILAVFSKVQREGAKSLFSKKLEISDLLLTQSSVQMEEMHSMTEPKDKEEEVKVQEGSKGEEEVGMKVGNRDSKILYLI